MGETIARIESRSEINAYIQNLKYALDNDATVAFQAERRVDQNRDIRNTNQFTIADLFPDADPVEAIREELQNLTIAEYIQTVRDLRFPNRSEMREFGKTYTGKGDVYIKIRVELLSDNGNHTAFVMSFHYSTIAFVPELFPYGKPSAQEASGNEDNSNT